MDYFFLAINIEMNFAASNINVSICHAQKWSSQD
jgi:hypothetical protein